MTTSAPRRRHLASSPFQADPEPIIQEFELDEMVSHDSYGMGRVVSVEPNAVTVDFRPKLVRITSPFARLGKL